VELAVNPGQLVQHGVRLGSIDQEEATSKLVGLLYFPVKDGKKIRVGMPIQSSRTRSNVSALAVS